MQILKFSGENNSPKKNTKMKIFLGVGLLALIPAIGSTLAASITIGNNNAAINFGQGVVQTTACDSAVTTTASSSYSNSSGNGTFKAGTVAITGISSGCQTKQFTIKLWPDTSTVLATCVITSFSSSNVASATACNTSTPSGITYTSTAGTGADGSISVDFSGASGGIDATNVYKVTIETA